MKDYAVVARWFYNNHGKTFHPLEVVGILGGCYENPWAKYFFLERKGHLIPQSYTKGEVDSVLVYSPERRKIPEIEQRHALPKDALRKKLNDLFTLISVRVNTIGLPQKVLEELKENKYLKYSHGMVRLGKAGLRFVEAIN